MKKNRLLFALSVIFLMPFIFSCTSETKDEDNGQLIFKFTHKVNNDSVKYNQMIYTNAAGNAYQVELVRWFISNLTLYRHGQAPVIIAKSSDLTFAAHYIDTKIPSTLTWSPDFVIPQGNYDSIGFTFGLDEATNKTGLFRNSPEKDFFWPDILGGGYHYLQFNGFYKDSNNIKKAFNFHMGIGQIYTASDTTFVQNYFTVNLKNSAFTSQNGEKREIQIIMNLEKWFVNPVFDFNTWGGEIMQKQNAMAIAAKNGVHVFTVGYIRKVE